MKIFNVLRKRITASAQPCQSASSLPRHSLRMLLALSILLALLAACGDESSSSVSPEPGDDSSSSVIPASSGDLQSSSSQKSSDKEKSSSSEKNAKESSSSAATVKNSSSSAGDNKSSSSVKKEDSCSSVEIASSSSSIKVDGSSASVKPESSSTATSSAAVASSSSVAELSSSSSYDRTDAFKGTLWRKGEYKTFVDARDNREYYYIEIAGEDTAGKAATIKVMAENLNVGEKVYGFEDQEDDTKIERYCYDDDTTNCNKYGGLYQWAEMMQLPSRCNTESCADSIKPNHQGICPDGWRLLTYNDLYIVIHSNNNEDGVKGIRAGRFGGSDDSGYSLVSTGYLWDHSFTNVENGTYWHYPVESEQYNGIASKVSSQWRTATGNSYDDSYKTQGFSVRCVMVE
ncbi:major paralogous domain-containing protein [Fibrobacter sp. UWOV1]|uniref:FISUMP domain-containing protein n=1 Tax=Fibrobacter sp. UWOV1 TaxID=1896215 RepID=UPI0009236831|nr:FISUMP domain-containing protein [Fibrobacter sp. UWOV1]SHK55194.1 major paralogous domain-containing protein [Fibrobacter sp. UWOV1]